MKHGATVFLGAGLITAIACRQAERPGFEVVRVPEVAYLAVDASAPPDAGRSEAGAGRGAGAFRPRMPPSCMAAPAKPPNDEEASSDYPECPANRGEKYLDTSRTEGVRAKMGRTDVCCYAVPMGVE